MRLKKRDAYIEVAQETSDDDDIVLEEVIERSHVDLFPEEHIVREVLDNLRNDHEPSPHSSLVFLWQLDVDRVWGYDRRGNKSQEHESPESGKFRVRPDFIPARV